MVVWAQDLLSNVAGDFPLAALIAILHLDVEAEHGCPLLFEGGPVFIGDAGIFDGLPDGPFCQTDEDEVEQVIGPSLEGHLRDIDAQFFVAQCGYPDHVAGPVPYQGPAVEIGDYHLIKLIWLHLVQQYRFRLIEGVKPPLKVLPLRNEL